MPKLVEKMIVPILANELAKKVTKGTLKPAEAGRVLIRAKIDAIRWSR